MGKHWDFGVHVFMFTLFAVTANTCLGTANITQICFPEEKLALLRFKHSLVDESGMLSSWVAGEDCCGWERVGCDHNTGHVVKLDLRGSLSSSYLDDGCYLAGGEVSFSALVKLMHLNYLDLSVNDFGRSRIPEFLGSLKQLRYLNLSHAGFFGMIPHHLGNLSNLNVVDLSDNDNLIGDDVAWVSSLSSLQLLDMSEVDLASAQNIFKVLYITPLIELYLSGCGISTGQLLHSSRYNSSLALSKIQHLDLGRNLFQGPFLPFLENMSSLEFLDLSYYNLTYQPLGFGKLLNMFPSLPELNLYFCGLHNSHLSPSHFNSTALANIQRLGLGGNSIEGKFPSVLTNMSSLSVLDLSSNRLMSSIPVMNKLVQLDLWGNSFHNIEETRIWNQCHLKWLNLEYNIFQGEMVGPSTNVSNCVQLDLEVLDLSRNKFTGSIPESLGRLTRLRELHLTDNRFTGPIPSSLGNLIALQQLHLDSNLLTGPIPPSLGGLISLKEFSVSSNMLNGTIPVSIGQLAKLMSLDISYNFLEGLVSETHLAKLSMLKHFDATSNWLLTFNMSQQWTPPFQLTSLQLRSCKIVSEFPQWLQTQRKLKELVLSNASISGPLPRWFQDIPPISRLDLSHNLISGPLTNLPCDKYLLLQNNIFNGSIPKSLCERTTLEYLDISRNRLSGELPQCLQKLRYLSAMVLSSNMLSGVIPSWLFHRCSSLQWLQMNNNSFHGELPLSMANCKSLQVVDLGENNFFGSIPKWLGKNITRLGVLRLHKNNFSGSIPRELCRNSDLQILDLAHNNLTGTIPQCFSEFVVMGAKDVSGSFVNNTVLFEQAMNAVMKGVVLEYTKTMQYVVNMDLSSNHLVGEIPKGLTSRSGLVGLNLSHNLLNGSIPAGIGDMKALVSLDLSANKLSGVIPPSIADLNFLSHLNLSNNDLSGRIPTGNQLQTLDDSSIYAGNRGLCGTPLPKDCSNDEDSKTRSKVDKDEASDEPDKVWLYLNIMSGFATGFWGVIGVLLFKKHWRQKLFRLVEVTVDKVYVGIAVRVSKMKRVRECIKDGA